jgi:hypothetical protein
MRPDVFMVPNAKGSSPDRRVREVFNSAFDQGRGRLLVSGFMLKRALDGFGLADC